MQTDSLISILTALLLASLLIATGYLLLNRALQNWDKYPLSLRLSASYFIGIAQFLSIYRTASYITEMPQLSAYAAIGLSIYFVVLLNRTLYQVIFEICRVSSIYTLILTFFVLGIFLFLFWMPRDTLGDQPFSTVASLHSVRYAWISNYISVCQHIPILGQNIGQALLSHATGTLFKEVPFVFMYAWLVMSVSGLCGLIYGLLKLYISNKIFIIISLAIIMLGNTALSLTHVVVIDSWSPFIINGYPDTVIGVASIFLILQLIVAAQSEQSIVRRRYIWLTTVFLLVQNFISAPQNILFIFALTPVLFWHTRYVLKNKKFILYWTSALLIATAVSLPQGGMLTPAKWQDKIDYAGIMSAAGRKVSAEGVDDARTKIAVVPGYAFFQSNYFTQWKSGQEPLLIEGKRHLESVDKNWTNIFWVFEQLLMTSLRVLFWPLLGLLGIIWLIKKHSVSKTTVNCLRLAPSVNMFAVIGGLVFLMGFVVCFSISLNDYKWELSRFMIPGIILGLFCLCISLNTYLSGKYYSTSFSVILCCTIILGPLIQITGQIFLNTPVNNVLLNVFNGSGPDVGHLSCRKLDS